MLIFKKRSIHSWFCTWVLYIQYCVRHAQTCNKFKLTLMTSRWIVSLGPVKMKAFTIAAVVLLELEAHLQSKAISCK